MLARASQRLAQFLAFLVIVVPLLALAPPPVVHAATETTGTAATSTATAPTRSTAASAALTASASSTTATSSSETASGKPAATTASTSTTAAASTAGAGPAVANPTGGGLGALPWYPLLSYPLTDRMGFQVNLASGNLLVHATDLAIPGTGLPLVIDRWYNNLLATAGTRGSVGRGWTLSVGQDVHQTVTAYNGPSAYQISVSGNQVPGVDATLVYDPNAPSPYVLTFNHSGVREDFNSQGDESAIVDPNGNTITLSPLPKLFYQPAGAFSSIVDTQGRTTSVTDYTVYGTITGLTDPSGRHVAYSADNGQQLLDSVVDANQQRTSFTYGIFDDLTQIADPLAS